MIVKKKEKSSINYIIILFIILFPVNVFSDSALKIHVSILPQKYFVEKIGKEKVMVDVLVKPGKSPATYAPTPAQIKRLAMSDIYFKTGLPFENGILSKIASMDQIKIININQDVILRNMTGHSHSEKSDHHDHSTGKDPHTWMAPMIVKNQAKTIYQSLANIDPVNKDEYKNNYLAFIKELDILDNHLRSVLKELKGKNLFVFHPFLGYFTDAYGLKQIAIETMGKAPKGKELSRIIKLAKKQKIKKIFVQPQFDVNTANKIALIINGSVISIDPLAYDYLANMEKIGKIIFKELN